MSEIVAANESPLVGCELRPLKSAGAPRLPWWSLILLALLALGIYANSLWNGFALDDVAIVQGNAHVNNLDWLEIWTDNYWPRRDGVPPDILYRPLTIWSYVATRAVVGGSGNAGAWAFHLGNIFLHALVCVMAALLIWRLCGNRVVAFLAGLLFALHPIHAEAVANVVGRAELLSAAFSLAALLVFLPSAPLPLETGPKPRRYWHGILVGMCFFLALLCKETPVALLGGLVLIDMWRWSRWEKSTRPSLARWCLRQSFRYYLPLAIFLGIYLAMRLNACGMLRDPHGISPLVNPLVDASFAQRLITPFALLAKYLQLCCWPRILSADYSFPSVLPTANLLAPLAMIGLLATALAVIVAVRCRRKHPAIMLGMALFGTFYGLVANFLLIGTIMGERLFYLPSLFVFMLVSLAIYGGYRAFVNVPRPALRRCIAAGMLLAACGALSYRTFVRNTDWMDNITLAIASGRDNPYSAKTCMWAGSVLARADAPAQFQPFGNELLHRAIELYPNYGEAYFELAKTERLHDHLGQSLLYLAHAAQFGPGKSDIRMGLDAIKNDLHDHDAASYMPELRAYADKNLSEASGQLALAVAAYARGELAEADQRCSAALKLDGHFHEAACELALIRLDEGQRELAIDVLLQYVGHVRSNAAARIMLVTAFLDLDQKRNPGALAKAGYFLDEAARLNKDDPRLRELRARLTRMQAERAAATPALTSAVPTGGRP